MKKIFAILASIALFSASSLALAADGDFEKADVDKDGKLTLEESMTVHSDWTEEAFKEFDEDEDGSLSKEEYDAAVAE